MQMDRKKQRGQRRRLKAMFGYIDKFVPFSDTEQKYEHFHVPSGPFIESKRTSGSVKTAFCRKWLETTEKFISQKPVEQDFCKIAAVLSVPNLWSSQIIIFYDESYYDSFWDRTYPEQFWTLVEDKRSFCKDRNIVTSLAERCYHEKIVGDENIFECDLWFYGDLPMNKGKEYGNMEKFLDEIAPFFWVDHEDSVSVCLNVGEYLQDVFDTRANEGFEGSGYDWESLAKVFLEERIPDLIEKVKFDSESSMFCAYSEDAAALREFIVGFKNACENNALILDLFSHAELD